MAKPAESARQARLGRPGTSGWPTSAGRAGSPRHARQVRQAHPDTPGRSGRLTPTRPAGPARPPRQVRPAHPGTSGRFGRLAPARPARLVSPAGPCQSGKLCFADRTGHDPTGRHAAIPPAGHAATAQPSWLGAIRGGAAAPSDSAAAPDPPHPTRRDEQPDRSPCGGTSSAGPTSIAAGAALAAPSEPSAPPSLRFAATAAEPPHLRSCCPAQGVPEQVSCPAEERGTVTGGGAAQKPTGE